MPISTLTTPDAAARAVYAYLALLLDQFVDALSG